MGAWVRPMKRGVPVDVPVLIALALLTVIAILGMKLADRPVVTTGPCTMLGIAELADHPGAPFLVIDCDGYQFGVPAVLP